MLTRGSKTWEASGGPGWEEPKSAKEGISEPKGTREPSQGEPAECHRLSLAQSVTHPVFKPAGRSSLRLDGSIPSPLCGAKSLHSGSFCELGRTRTTCRPSTFSWRNRPMRALLTIASRSHAHARASPSRPHRDGGNAGQIGRREPAAGTLLRGREVAGWRISRGHASSRSSSVRASATAACRLRPDLHGEPPCLLGVQSPLSRVSRRHCKSGSGAINRRGEVVYGARKMEAR